MSYDHDIVARNERMKQNQVRMCAQQYHARTAKESAASEAAAVSITTTTATTTGTVHLSIKHKLDCLYASFPPSLGLRIRQTQ